MACVLSTALFLAAPCLSAQNLADSRTVRDAYRLFEEREFEEAAEVLESLHKDGALGASQAALLGMVYLNLERIDDANWAAKLAVWLDPDDYLTMLLQGNLALLDEDFPEAEAIFSRARILYPNRSEAVNGMTAAIAGDAVRLLDAGAYGRAADRFGDALAYQPENHRLLLGRIAALGRTGRAAELESAYRAYLLLVPNNADMHASLGTHLFDRGRRAEALHHLERAVELDTANPRAFLVLGRIAAEEDVRHEARSLIHEAIGKAVRLYGRYRLEATRLIQESRELSNTADEQAMERLKELSEAAEQPRRILEEALASLPGLYSDEQDLAEDLARLSEWYPSSAALRQALAETYVRAGRGEEAEQVWEELIRRTPLNFEGHLGLGRSRMEAGDYHEASLSLRRALDISPGTEAIYATLQEVYRRWGREEGFLEILEQRMLKDGYNPLLYRFAAEAAQNVGLPEKAEEYRRRAEELEEY